MAWYLMIHHRHGTDISLYVTPELAAQGVESYAREYWAEEHPDVPMPDGDVAEEYFRKSPDEMYDIDCRVIQGSTPACLAPQVARDVLIEYGWVIVEMSADLERWAETPGGEPMVAITRHGATITLDSSAPMPIPSTEVLRKFLHVLF